MDEGENLNAAAARELKEETGLVPIHLTQVMAFGEPGRDPRGPTVSVAFAGWVESTSEPEAGSDAGKARWFNAEALPELAFDHDSIIEKAKEKFLV